MLYYLGESLLPCIIVHSAINTLGTFANDAGLTVEMQLIHVSILIVITVAYTLILPKTLPKKQGDKKAHAKYLRVPFWCIRRGSNPKPFASEAKILSS